MMKLTDKLETALLAYPKARQMQLTRMLEQERARRKDVESQLHDTKVRFG